MKADFRLVLDAIAEMENKMQKAFRTLGQEMQSGFHARGSFLAEEPIRKRRLSVGFESGSVTPPHDERRLSFMEGLEAKKESFAEVINLDVHGNNGDDPEAPSPSSVRTTSRGLARLPTGWSSMWPSDIRWRDELDIGAEWKGPHSGNSERDAALEWDLDVILERHGIREATHKKNRLDALVMHPDARKRWAFDVTSILMLVVDAIFTPYSMTFELDNAVVNLVFMTFLGAFWFTDMCLSFLTGYQTPEGEIELRFVNVAKHYFRTTFILDGACVAVDVTAIVEAWLEVSHGSKGGFARFLRVAKLQRVFRIFSMVRLFRVMKKFSDFMEAKVSQQWKLIVLVLQVSALLMWLCHVFACIWYAIGQWAPQGEISHNWLETSLYDQEGTRVRDQEKSYRYIAACHWALAQITLGATDVPAITSAERIFTMACNFFGLIFGGALVSILSTTLIELRELNHENNTTISVLQNYLLEHNVVLATRLRVLHQVKDRVQARDKVITEKDVRALQVLSHTLLKELRGCVFSQHLLKHPLFITWDSLSADALKIVCSQGLAFLNIHHEDELFAVATESHRVFFLMDGALEYFQDPRDGFVEQARTTEVLPQTWLSEATWWCHWVHTGDAYGTSISSLLTVSPETVISTMARQTLLHSVTMEYAKRFYEQVIQPPQNCHPDDLHVPCTEFHDVMSSAPRETHLTLGLHALEHHLKHQRAWKLEKKTALAKLVDEIRSGQSLVLLGSDGLWRSASITCVEIENADGDLLIEVAGYDSTFKRWNPSVRLPGAKRSVGETFNESFERLFSSRMSNLRGVLGHYEVYHTEETKASEHFGIGTHYSKTICVFRDKEADFSALQECLRKRAVVLKYTQNMDEDLMPSEQKSGRLGTADRAEQLSLELSNISVAYRISGSTHSGIYAWLSRSLFGELTKQEGVVAKWVASMATSLPSQPEIEMESEVTQVFKF